MTDEITKSSIWPPRLGRRIKHAYQGKEKRPLGGYLVSMGTYAGLVSVGTIIGRIQGTQLPERFSIQDTALLCVATHKASRLLAKEAVTSPLRAPFTRYREATGEAELAEDVRGTGIHHAVGELVTCPFCLGVWIATGLTAAMVFAPRATRLLTTALTAVAVSDVMHLGYDGAKQLSQK